MITFETALYGVLLTSMGNVSNPFTSHGLMNLLSFVSKNTISRGMTLARNEMLISTLHILQNH